MRAPSFKVFVSMTDTVFSAVLHTYSLAVGRESNPVRSHSGTGMSQQLEIGERVYENSICIFAGDPKSLVVRADADAVGGGAWIVGHPAAGLVGKLNFSHHLSLRKIHHLKAVKKGRAYEYAAGPAGGGHHEFPGRGARAEMDPP